MIGLITALALGATQLECPPETKREELRLADGSMSFSCLDGEGLPRGPMWNRARNGRVRWIERYKNGLPEGVWERFTRDGGVLERRVYTQGRLSGEWGRWYDDGRLRQRVSMRGGKKDGESRFWHRDGSTDARVSFKKGLPDGEWQLFGREGKLQASCRYSKGIEKGASLKTIERPLERVHVVERLSELKTPVKFCFDRELARRPELSRGGRVDFKFLVTPVGLTADVQLERTTLKDPSVESCIADVIEQLRFPRLVTCEMVEVAFPFELVATK